ncbi:MAG: RecQ family ATP-dependent DNA helicase, partial [Parcubacteria group bacterium]|nr:RecQ family ATP-dependent DNA helicase [Parcubacteria group bacterium]
EWGHDFRPDYRSLRNLRTIFPGVPMMALTATATKRVRKDIIEQLELKKGQSYMASFNRPNLTYIVKPKDRAFENLVMLLEKYKGESVIVYCFSRKNTEDLAEDLRYEGLKAKAYHAGLEQNERRETQDKFIKDEIDIIVATIAFGMGIDKPDVRLIVHYSLPKTLEGYYQETGRAGRDGLPSECVLFYSYGDKAKQGYFISQIEDKAEQRNAYDKLSQVIEFCELATCRRKYLMEYFGENWKKDNCKACDSCLTPRAEFDATEIAQKILSAVIRTEQYFGTSHIIMILTGSKSKKIRDLNHDTLTVYNIVNDFSRTELRDIIGQLIKGKLLMQDIGKYPILKMTNKGYLFLKNRESINLAKFSEVDVESSKVKESLKYNEELFENLRILRKKLADQKGVSPFIIFSDVALQEMAYYLPQGLESFAKISGVGKEKLSQFGNKFLKVIVKFTKDNKLEEKTISKSRTRTKSRAVRRTGSTYDETKKMILKQLSIMEVAKRRGITEGTVLGHFEKIINTGEHVDIEYLKPNKKRLKQIKKAFQESEQLNLSPVKGILGEEYSYDELRLARLFLF